LYFSEIFDADHGLREYCPEKHGKKIIVRLNKKNGG
jgi:hypothetical protein